MCALDSSMSPRTAVWIALSLVVAAGCSSDLAELETNSDRQDTLDSHEPNDGFATAAELVALHEQQPVASLLEISAAPGDVVGNRAEDWYALPYTAGAVTEGLTEVVAHSVRIHAKATPGVELCAYYEGATPLACIDGEASFDVASGLHGCCGTEWRRKADDADWAELVTTPAYAEASGRPELSRILVRLRWASTEFALDHLPYVLQFDEVR